MTDTTDSKEREAFKAAHRQLELDEVPDAWGRPMFKHSHVEASWLGWKARASLAANAVTDCARCGGSGEDPEGFYDQSRGDAGHTHDGPCRTCNGSGVAANAGSEPVAADGAAVLCWVNEDELPEGLTQEAYSALFPHSKVDVVRMFPVFGPTAQAAPAGATDAGDTYADYQAWVDLATQASQMGDEPHAELRKSWEPGQRWQQRLPAFTEWFNLSVPPAWFWYAEYRRNPDDVAPTAQPAPAATPQADSQPAPSAAAWHREWRFALKEAIDTMEAEIDTREDEENVRRMKRATVVLNSMLAAAPQPSPTPQADSQPAQVRVSKDRLPNWSVESHMDAIPDPVASVTTSDARVVTPCRAARAPADSVTAPAGGAVAGPLDSLALMKVVMQADEALSGRCTRGTTNWAAAIGKAVQRAVVAAPQPAPPADSVLEDAARLLESQHTWLTNVAAANLVRSLAARKQGANHD